MPIHEYRCEPCDHTFETLIRRSTDVAHCPKCGTIDVLKQFSVPAAAQTGAGAGASSLPICGQPSPSPGSFGCGSGGCGTGMCSMD
jgi:putative FmdB family regulatory protein